MKSLNLALVFACEVALVTAVAWWGASAGGVVAGIVTGGALVVFWGAVMAPKARWRLPEPLRTAVALVLFALGTAAFVGVGETVVAIVFAAAAAGSTAAAQRWPEAG